MYLSFILFLNSEFRGTSDGNNLEFWLAGNDLDREGEWRWVTSGQLVSFRDWVRGQPNNAGRNQDCMVYEHLSSAWRDDSCERRSWTLCEL